MQPIVGNENDYKVHTNYLVLLPSKVLVNDMSNL